jgi:hypothetical protein
MGKGRTAYDDREEDDDNSTDVERVRNSRTEEMLVRCLLTAQNRRLKVRPRREPGMKDERDPVDIA